MSCISGFLIHRPQRCTGSACGGRSCLVSSADRLSPEKLSSFPATPSHRDIAPGNTLDSFHTSFFGPSASGLSYTLLAHRPSVFLPPGNPGQRIDRRKDTSFPMTSPFGIDSGVIADLFGPILSKRICLNEKKTKKNNPEINRKDYSAER